MVELVEEGLEVAAGEHHGGSVWVWDGRMLRTSHAVHWARPARFCTGHTKDFVRQRIERSSGANVPLLECRDFLCSDLYKKDFTRVQDRERSIPWILDPLLSLAPRNDRGTVGRRPIAPTTERDR